MIGIRENWRVIALVILIVVSAILLFLPGVGLGNTGEDAGAVTESGPTNLQYGLELSGGTRIRAPLVGMTAEGVNISVNEQADVERAVADNLDAASRGEVQARARQGTIEVFTKVERENFAAALDAAGVNYEEIRRGVTEETRSDAVAVIRDKIDESGLAGGQVQEVTTSTGDHFIVIEVPNRNRSEVQRLVAQRGLVEVVAHFPADSGDQEFRDVTVLTQEDIANVGPVQEPNSQIPQPHVPLTLTNEGAAEFAAQMRQFGFTGPGIEACPPDAPPIGNNPQGYCLYTVLDGEVVYSARMSGDLATSIENGDFEASQNFVMTATNRTEARALQINLRAGALPAPLDLEDRGTSQFLAPSLAQNFKLYSLITGLIAVLAVVLMVFLRYGNPVVAGPMIITALSEVVILLGFAALTGLALDLSHIAGLIAVIGTGVDDLIIIADEVMAQGSVNSGRVFQNRFRKAFWVIGAAAITTIIAMSPLAILSLGDLRGFAIITILGVLVGVIITRPAYGDILRNFLTEK